MLDFLLTIIFGQGQYSIFDIVTCCGLYGPSIKSQWGRNFLHLSRPALGHTQTPSQWVLGLFPGGKVTSVCHWPPTPSRTELKERIVLYFSPLWEFMIFYRVNFYSIFGPLCVILIYLVVWRQVQNMHLQLFRVSELTSVVVVMQAWLPFPLGSHYLIHFL